MKRKEPKFMQELHKIRARLSKEWKKASVKEISDSLHQAVKEFQEKFVFAQH
jgi:hypothetical protein